MRSMQRSDMSKAISDWISLGLLLAACVLTLRMYFGKGDE